jgi:hypothetical protein
VVRIDGEAEVYLNGELIWSVSSIRNNSYRWNQRFAIVDVTRRVSETIRQGQNLLAVRIQKAYVDCTFDLGLLQSK